MGFVEAVKSFYGRYFDFATRSSRSEYWWVMLFFTVIYIALMIPLFGAMGASIEQAGAGDPLAVYGPIFSVAGIPFILFMLINFIPSIALAIRRLHDLDKSGWFYLLFVVLSMIPFIGLLAAIGWIVFMCMRGTVGDNRFGPDPLGASVGDTFS